jgi:hypothetical protein
MNPAGKLLAYCVFERRENCSQSVGVDDQPVRHVDFQDLVALYSDFPSGRDLGQEDALRFHAVLKSVFEKQAIIPFRFPTFLDNQAALHDVLRENYVKYLADLSRFRDFVQMELRISGEPPKENRSSGKDYLESKRDHARTLQQAIQAVRDSARVFISDSRERATDQGIRFYALTSRADAASFRERVKNINAPTGLRILVSGPWPPTEFLHE